MNKIRLISLVCTFAMFVGIHTQGQIDPGVEFDLQGFIDDMITTGETTIIIPPGRYRVSANGKNHHLGFANLSNISIMADSVEMICTETVQAIQISRCINFRLQGITVDYDPLPFTQGQIVEMSEDKRVITADFTHGYSTTVRGNKLEIYDPITGELSTTTYYGITYAVDTENRQIVITKPANYQPADSHEQIGDIVVLDSQKSRHIPHAIVPDRCTDLVIEDVQLYAGTTFGFFEENCSNSKYINCRIDRRPLSTEIAERGLSRMRSINADGFHSKHATAGPKYYDCLARYNGDDGIAINGHYHVITSTAGNKLIVVGKAGNTPNLAVGDTAELVSYTGNRIEDAIITEITKGPVLTDEEKAFLQSQRFNGSVSNTYKASSVYIVTIDRSVDLPMGSLIASANRIGNNFEVKNCTIGPNRSRGILVKASNGTISGNKLVGNRGMAIKLAPEYSWLEAGSGSNITVFDNDISECYDAAIAVYANGGNGKTAPAGAHKNIIITNNTISESSNPAIALTSIRGLMLENNTIEDPNNSLLVPWILNSFGRREDPSRKIFMKNVEFGSAGIPDNPHLLSPNVRIGPNPFSDQLSLEFTEQTPVPYSIIDMQGKKVFSSLTGKETVISASSWSPGIYILLVEGSAPLKLLKK